MTVAAFVQMSSSVTQMDFSWPWSIKWFGDILAAFANFDVLGAATPECMAENTVSYFVRWRYKLMALMFPSCILALMVFAAFFLGVTFSIGRSHVVKKHAVCRNLMTGPCRALEAKFRRLVVVMSSPALGVFLLTYTFMASMGADPFNCMETAQCDAAADHRTLAARAAPGVL